MTYDEACRRAATNQGLDPIVNTLNYCGVAHTVAQTGGFCMVVTIPVATGTYAVTADAPDEILVGFYAGQSWLEGESAGDEPMSTMTRAAFNIFASGLIVSAPDAHPTFTADTSTGA